TGEPLGGRAVVAAQDRFVDVAAVEIKRELFGNALALVLRAVELDSERAGIGTRDGAFEAPEAVDIDDNLRTLRRHDLAGDARAAGRHVRDLAMGFAAFGGDEEAARKGDRDTLVAPALRAGFRDQFFLVCRHMNAAQTGGSRIQPRTAFVVL